MPARYGKFAITALLVLVLVTAAPGIPAAASEPELTTARCGPTQHGDPLTGDCSAVRDRTQEFLYGPQATFDESPPNLDQRPASSIVSRTRPGARKALTDDPPVPGGLGAGVVYDSLGPVDSATLFTTVLFSTEGIHPNGDMSWLMLPATNRMYRPTELTVVYNGDNNGSLGLFARSCSVDYPCPDGTTGASGWQWFIQWDQLQCNLFDTADEGGHAHQAIRYANRTERQDNGSPPEWRNTVYLWNHCETGWDLVYDHTYREVKNPCGQFGCAWWGPIVETWEPLAEVDEVGFQDTTLIHDGAVSYLEPGETDFIFPGDRGVAPYVVYHRTPNRAFTAGNRVTDADTPDQITLDQDTLSLNDFDDWCDPGHPVSVGQRFAQIVRPGLNGPLSKIDIRLLTDGPVTVEVQSVENGMPTGDVLASQSYPAMWFAGRHRTDCSDWPNHPGVPNPVYFDEPAEVEAGQSFALVFTTEAGYEITLDHPHAYDDVTGSLTQPYIGGALLDAPLDDPDAWQMFRSTPQPFGEFTDRWGQPTSSAAFASYVGAFRLPAGQTIFHPGEPPHAEKHFGGSLGAHPDQIIAAAAGPEIDWTILKRGQTNRWVPEATIKASGTSSDREYKASTHETEIWSPGSSAIGRVTAAGEQAHWIFDPDFYDGYDRIADQVIQVFRKDPGIGWTADSTITQEGWSDETGDNDVPNVNLYEILVAGESVLVVTTSWQDQDINHLREALVFSRSIAGVWQLKQSIDVPGNSYEDYEPVVEFSDGIIVISDMEHSEFEGGAIITSVRDEDGQWSPMTRFAPLDIAPGDFFGWRVALDGRWLAVLAPGKDSIYLYELDASGNWSLESQLMDVTGIDVSGYSDPAYLFDEFDLRNGILTLRYGDSGSTCQFRSIARTRSSGWLPWQGAESADTPYCDGQFDPTGRRSALIGTGLVWGEPSNSQFSFHAGALRANDFAGGHDPLEPNQPPLSANDNTQLVRGGQIQIPVLSNDNDPDGDPLFAYIDTSPQSGFLKRVSEGRYQYRHDGSDTTSDQFVYAATDRLPGAPSYAEVDIGIVANASAPFFAELPQAQPDPPVYVRSGSAYLYDWLMAEDPDPGDGLTVEVRDAPAWMVVDTSNLTMMSFIGTPGDGDIGANVVSLRVTDLAGQTDALSWTVQVAPAGHDNTRPVANRDTLETRPGGTATALLDGGTSVLANDTDADGDPLSAVLISQPAKGTVVLNADGTFSYTHDGSAAPGTDSFPYVADDGDPYNGTSFGGGVDVLINRPATATDDTIDVDEGGTVSMLADGETSVLANDSDDEGDDVTAVLVNDVQSGTLTLNTDGTFSYTHDGGEDPFDQFTYIADDGKGPGAVAATVRININPVNDAPVITTSPPRHARVGELFDYDFEIDDPDVGSRLAAGGSTLPGWLEIDAPVSPGSTAVPANHVFALFGTPGPADIGNTDVEIVIEDEGGLEARQAFTLLVLPAVPLMTVVPDTNFNGADDLALLRRDSAGTWQMEVRDSGTGRPLAAFTPGAVTESALAVEPGDDIDGAGISELSVLLIDDGTRQFRVDSFDAFSGALSSSVPMLGARYEPLGLATLGQALGVAPQVAALARHRTTGTIVVQVRAADTGVRLGNLNYLGPAYTPLAIATLPDTDGDGSPELAVLAMRNADRRFLVQARNSPSGSAPRNVWFLGPDYEPLGLATGPDANADGAPELIVLARRRSNGRLLAQVRNVTGPALPRSLWMLNDSFLPLGMQIVPDADNNGVFETAILGVRLSDGRAAVQWRNADRLGAKPVLWFLDTSFLPAGISVVPDRDGNGVPDIGVLGTRPGDLRDRMHIKNAAGLGSAADVWFSVPP